MNDSSSQKGLVNELVGGRDLTKQLQKMILSNELRSSCNNVYGQVIQNILAKFEKSLQILQFDPDEQSQFQQSNNDSPFSGSPKSQDFDRDVKNSLDHKNDSKKKRYSKLLLISLFFLISFFDDKDVIIRHIIIRLWAYPQGARQIKPTNSRKMSFGLPTHLSFSLPKLYDIRGLLTKNYMQIHNSLF